MQEKWLRGHISCLNAKLLTYSMSRKLKIYIFFFFFSFFSLHPLPWKVRSFLVKHWNKFLQQTYAHPINPSNAWKIESNYEGLLNKNCCNGVSCTQLLMIQTMGSKKNFFFLPFVIYLSWFDLLNLSSFSKIPLMDGLDILSMVLKLIRNLVVKKRKGLLLL